MIDFIPEVINRPTSNVILRFNGKFMGPILSGDKTQTIRLKPKNINRFEFVYCIFTDSDMKLKLYILSRGGTFFKDLTKDDAHREGYRTLKELQDELRNIYPNIHSFTPLYWYRFKVVG